MDLQKINPVMWEENIVQLASCRKYYTGVRVVYWFSGLPLILRYQHEIAKIISLSDTCTFCFLTKLCLHIC